MAVSHGEPHRGVRSALSAASLPPRVAFPAERLQAAHLAEAGGILVPDPLDLSDQLRLRGVAAGGAAERGGG